MATRAIRRPAIRAVLLALTVIVSAGYLVRAATPGAWADTYAYWTYRLGPGAWTFPPNANLAGASVSHNYSPAFAQAIAPLQALSFPAFSFLWTAGAIALLILLVGPRWAGLAALLLPPVDHELWNPNVALALAAVSVWGLRWPALWAAVFLTKITPGVGVAWFLVRREWRSLAIALSATATILALSVAVDSSSWQAWVGWLRANNGAATPGYAFAVPLGVRLPLALALTAWAARTDRPWVLPMAVWIALPFIAWQSSVLFLAPAVRCLRRDDTNGAVARDAHRPGDGLAHHGPEALRGGRDRPHGIGGRERRRPDQSMIEHHAACSTAKNWQT